MDFNNCRTRIDPWYQIPSCSQTILLGIYRIRRYSLNSVVATLGIGDVKGNDGIGKVVSGWLGSSSFLVLIVLFSGLALINGGCLVAFIFRRFVVLIVEL